MSAPRMADRYSTKTLHNSVPRRACHDRAARGIVTVAARSVDPARAGRAGLVVVGLAVERILPRPRHVGRRDHRFVGAALLILEIPLRDPPPVLSPAPPPREPQQ